MDLYILRHGVAEERDPRKYPGDFDRPLTKRGVRRLVRQAMGWNALGLPLDVIVTSPLARAAQTAKVMKREIRGKCSTEYSDHLAPGGDHALLMDHLAERHATADGVMLVGHEPDLSSLVSVLSAGSPFPVIRLKKGACCKLSLTVSRYGRCGWIEWALSPKQMANLAKR